jgi:hypothetical protein
MEIEMASKTQELYERAKEFTDAGNWKHSWHWPKGDYDLPNIETLKAAQIDLYCIDRDKEIKARIARIDRRYQLFNEIEEFIKFMEED